MTGQAGSQAGRGRTGTADARTRAEAARAEAARAEAARAEAARAERARADWEQRIYDRLDEDSDGQGERALPAPAGVRAEGGAGHIRLSWDPVTEAAGYVIERTGAAGGPHALTHGGSDVAAVPSPPFADTGVTDGADYQYRIGAVTGAGQPVLCWSQPVRSRSADGTPGPVLVHVDTATAAGQLDRVWRMVGAERLSQLRLGADEAGRTIAAEFAAALRLAHDDLGVRQVRAHAILHDDNAVVRRAGAGRLSCDFTAIDAIYDQLLAIGIRPVVELSFMPAALARDPGQTVFSYGGIISPPRDWREWRQLVIALASHLVQRYGIDEVASWAFEVWNEPNLAVFWSGTKQEYLRLYDESARAVKSVDQRLVIGGPATAAGEWIEDLAAHAERTGTRLDFVSTHTYGNLPLDLRPALARHGLLGTPIWWTEWGAGSAHFGPVHDSVLGAPFVLTGLHEVQGRLQALAYWVVSDHFEELGRPERLFHNGFGLLSIGNLRKPRYWAVHLAEHLGDEVLASSVSGDGADVLVRAWATRHSDGTIDVLAWNGTINAALLNGDQRLDRHVRLIVDGLGTDSLQVSMARVDQRHSNVVAHCPPDVDWPDDELWARLRRHDGLWTERLPDVRPASGTARFDFDLPMPGIVRIRLTTSGPPRGAADPNPPWPRRGAAH